MVWFDPQTVTLSVSAPGEVSVGRIGRYREPPLTPRLHPSLIRWCTADLEIVEVTLTLRTIPDFVVVCTGMYEFA